MSLRAASKPFGKRPQEKLRVPTPWHKNIDMVPCAPQTPFKVQQKRLRSPHYFNFRKSRKGLRDLGLAMQDEAFRMGFTGKVEIKEGEEDYDWKANIKLPREFKVGRWGYGKPAYDFTNRYIGGPNQG